MLLISYFDFLEQDIQCSPPLDMLFSSFPTVSTLLNVAIPSLFQFNDCYNCKCNFVLLLLLFQESEALECLAAHLSNSLSDTSYIVDI